MPGLDPQGAVELATGDQLTAIGAGGAAQLLREGLGLLALDAGGLECASGSEGIESVGLHGRPALRWRLRMRESALRHASVQVFTLRRR